MKVQKRTENIKEVRAANQVPGVVYGKSIEPTPIKADLKEFVDAYQEYGKSMTFELRLGGKKHMAYFKEVQVDPVRKNRVVHFDLQKISKTDTIAADIPVEIINRDNVEGRGLVVEQIADTVHTEFPAGAGISNFTLDVEGLEGNDTLTVADLDLPEDFKVLDPEDKILVGISYPQEEEELPEEGAEEEEVEVEAIKQKDDDETEEEDKE